MSTRSRIGIENKDGTIESIYCHHDGYPSYVGKILMENYKDENKIIELISLGSLSILGPEIGIKHNFDGPKDKNICTAYYRDREEDWKYTKPEISKDYNDYLILGDSSTADYLYLYDFLGKVWNYQDMSSKTKDLKLLTQEIVNSD